MRNQFIRALLLFVLGMTLLSFTLFAEETSPRPLSFNIEPNPVRVDLFYGGCLLKIKGNTEPDAKIIAKVIRIESVEEELNLKGRIGPFYANIGKVRIGNAPTFLMLASESNIEQLLDPEENTSAKLSFKSVLDGITIEGNVENRETLLDEYLKMKQKKLRYQALEGVVRYGETSTNSKTFEIELAWPVNAPVGDYIVFVFHVKDGKIFRTEEERLSVEYKGFVAFLANMAQNYAAIYGILSVLIALITGLGIGTIFKKPSSH